MENRLMRMVSPYHLAFIRKLCCEKLCPEPAPYSSTATLDTSNVWYRIPFQQHTHSLYLRCIWYLLSVSCASHSPPLTNDFMPVFGLCVSLAFFSFTLSLSICSFFRSLFFFLSVSLSLSVYISITAITLAYSLCTFRTSFFNFSLTFVANVFSTYLRSLNSRLIAVIALNTNRHEAEWNVQTHVYS